MKKSLVILLAATLGLAACNREKKGAGGLLYTVHKSEGKEKIKVGDIIKMNFTQKNERDSVMGSSYENDNSPVFEVQKAQYAGDTNDALLLLGEGDSATFKVNIDTMVAFNKQPKPEQFKKDKYLVFTVKIEKVFKKNANEADSVFQNRARAFFEADHKASIEKKKNSEEGTIKAYIADKSLKTTTSASGLQYIVVKPGDAQRAVLGDTVSLNYTGSLTTKGKEGKYKVFDTSDEKVAKEAKTYQIGRPYGPTKMVVGGAIPGFTEAIQLIGKGGKITAIIPSKLGYADQGVPQAGIGAYSPLAFDVEIVDIIKGKPAPAAPVAPVAKP